MRASFLTDVAGVLKKPNNCFLDDVKEKELNLTTPFVEDPIAKIPSIFDCFSPEPKNVDNMYGQSSRKFGLVFFSFVLLLFPLSLCPIFRQGVKKKLFCCSAPICENNIDITSSMQNACKFKSFSFFCCCLLLLLFTFGVKKKSCFVVEL